MADGLRRAIAAAAATRRTPQEQADEFVRANDASPVIAGAALEENPQKPSKGARYKLANGGWHYVGAAAGHLLPDGYPKWEGL